MTYAVTYSSKTGNTKQLSEQILSVLSEQNKEVIYSGEVDQKASEADVIFAGFWTDKGTCTADLAEFLASLRDKKVFIYGTAGFGGAQPYFDQILSRVIANLDPSNELIGNFMCQGRMPSTVKARYEAALEKNPEDQRMKEMIKNFDQALAHPSEDDLLTLNRKLENFL